MSPMTKQELANVVAKRYLQTKSRKEKSVILDEFCANMGYNRKYAISKIREINFREEKEKKQRGRKKKYSPDLDRHLILIWEHFDCICAERLHPFLPEAIRKLHDFGYLNISAKDRNNLLSMSCPTIKRRLRTYKERSKQKSGLSATKPGYLLKREIPIQTICWDTKKAGFCEIDLVAHCGGSLSGDFIYTLQFVDIKSTWTERIAVKGKSQLKVFEGVKKIQNELLPFPLLGIDSDNGSEFINALLLRYCQRNNIAFTRSRPYMKKDNAHIEQKNYTTVRKVLGYDRFDTDEHLQLINNLYENELRLFINFFQPTMKLREKKRVGAKIIRKYDPAKTPYQRIMECPEVSKERKKRLKKLYESLDPVQLKKKIDEKVQLIIALQKKSGL